MEPERESRRPEEADRSQRRRLQEATALEEAKAQTSEGTVGDPPRGGLVPCLDPDTGGWILAR
jgi:hypothetical protein